MSVTAQRVAAHRLTFDRIPAPYGDPAADEALARDVATAADVAPGPMRDYLRARIRFFDTELTGTLGRGCPQVVIGAAGYDGRALRYTKPGVRWFEVDHPATQRDKRYRRDRTVNRRLPGHLLVSPALSLPQFHDRGRSPLGLRLSHNFSTGFVKPDVKYISPASSLHNPDIQPYFGREWGVDISGQRATRQPRFRGVIVRDHEGLKARVAK